MLNWESKGMMVNFFNVYLLNVLDSFVKVEKLSNREIKIGEYYLIMEDFAKLNACEYGV